MNVGLTDILSQAVITSTSEAPAGRVLDIGTGAGAAALKFKAFGHQVTATGYQLESYLGGESQSVFSDIELHQDTDVCNMKDLESAKFDFVWCSHVLEHVPDTKRALDEIWRVLKPGGTLFLIVPPFSPFLVGGHVSVGWNLGLVMYNLILAGFDVPNGHYVNHCWNLTAFVRKSTKFSKKLRFDNGDLEVLKGNFPENYPVHQGISGNLTSCNWHWHRGVQGASKRHRQFLVRDFVHSLTPPAVRDFFSHRRISRSK
jgi:SAM-dependent methyltransferase